MSENVEASKYVVAAFQYYDLSLNPVVSEEEDVLIEDGSSEDNNEESCSPGTSGDAEQVQDLFATKSRSLYQYFLVGRSQES